MYCTNCKAEVPASFEHAIKKNECPACGGEIMDEESLIFLSDLSSDILSSARIREETAKKIAMSLMSSYNISPRDEGTLRNRGNGTNRKIKRQAQSSEKEGPEELISDSERQEIMEERVAARYQMVSRDQALVVDENEARSIQEEVLSDTELLNSGLLEKERQKRILQQQQNLSRGVVKNVSP
jgi:hypothetical protein